VLFENNHEITKQSLENTRIAEDKKRLREDISRLERKIQEKNEIIESFKRSKTERLNQTRKEVNSDITGALKHYEIDNERLEKDLFECMNKIFRRTIEDINKETT
jgi:predicted nuclease with TOPRIM domain